jgi:16S rRNA (adenine1518-N6/adenine1519-N6)-dimethyltransferase
LLAENANRVVAVELDRKLVGALKDILSPYDNIELIQGDILEVNLNEIFTQPGYIVAANIPYYITSALLRQLLEATYAPQRVVLTVQKEVAQRICASTGNLSLLALSVQVYGEPSITHQIPAGAFFPVPKVNSAVVRIEIYPQPRIPREHLDTFFSLIKAGFAQKRKTLQNALSAGMKWEKQKTSDLLLSADIDPMRRAQTLGMEEWGNLVDRINSKG